MFLREMRVTRGHPQIPVAQEVFDVEQIRSLHSQPTGVAVSQIMQAKVFNAGITASADKFHAQLLRCEAFEEWASIPLYLSFRDSHCIEHHTGQIVDRHRT